MAAFHSGAPSPPYLGWYIFCRASSWSMPMSGVAAVSLAGDGWARGTGALRLRRAAGAATAGAAAVWHARLRVLQPSAAASSVRHRMAEETCSVEGAALDTSAKWDPSRTHARRMGRQDAGRFRPPAHPGAAAAAPPAGSVLLQGKCSRPPVLRSPGLLTADSKCLSVHLSCRGAAAAAACRAGQGRGVGATPLLCSSCQVPGGPAAPPERRGQGGCRHGPGAFVSVSVNRVAAPRKGQHCTPGP